MHFSIGPGIGVNFNFGSGRSLLIISQVKALASFGWIDVKWSLNKS